MSRSSRLHRGRPREGGGDPHACSSIGGARHERRLGPGRLWRRRRRRAVRERHRRRRPATTAAGGEGGATTEAGGPQRRPPEAAVAATASSACPGTTTRKSAGRSGTSRRCKAAIEAGGGTYISNDAKSSAETQASNVENLISQGANVLVILAQDGTAIKPSVASCRRERHPGHRLRPADRGSVGALRHVRQRQGR